MNLLKDHAIPKDRNLKVSLILKIICNQYTRNLRLSTKNLKTLSLFKSIKNNLQIKNTSITIIPVTMKNNYNKLSTVRHLSNQIKQRKLWQENQNI